MTRKLLLEHPVDLGQLPATRVTRHRGAALVYLAGAGLAFVSVIGAVIAKSGRPIAAGEQLFYGVTCAFALIALVRGLVRFTERRTVTIDLRGVSSVRSSCLGSTGWQEPRSAYLGVLRREVLVGSAADRQPPTVVHELRLVHDDEARSVTILATREGRVARERQDQACRVLSLPSLVVGVDGFVVTATEAVERTMAEVVRDQQLAAASVQLDRIPGELRVEPRTDGVGVTIDRCEMAWLSLPFIVGLPASLFWVCGEAPMPLVMRWVVFGFALLIAVALVGVFVLDRIGRRRLEVRGDHVDYFVRTPFGDLLRNRIDTTDLLSATVRRDQRGRPELAIEARDHSLEIGGGLPTATLEWLRALLIQNVKRVAEPQTTAATPHG